MNDRGWMEQVQLLDCNGRVTHTLTLLLDGAVEIRFAAGGHRAVVDPVRRTCLTPGMNIHADLMDAASTLRPT